MVHDVFHGMRETPKIQCDCGGLCHKIPVLGQFIYGADACWHSENDGKGRYISGLGKMNDPRSYARSLKDAEEKAKRKGLSYELT
jgi:hypothetical protein